MFITILNVLLYAMSAVNLVFAFGNLYNKRWFQGCFSLFVAVFCFIEALR